MIANMLCSFGERSHFPFCSTYISGFILLRTDRYGWVALLLCARTAWVCADGMLCGHDCCCAAVADFRCVEEMSDHGIFSIRDIPACAGSRCLLYGVLFCYRQSEACISERNRVIEDGVCIVLGIVFVVSIPKQWFQVSYWKNKRK